MSLSDKNRRKNVLINPPFQLSFLKQCFGLAAVVIGVVWAANTYFFWNLKQKGLQSGIDGNHVFFRFVEQQRQTMNWIFLGTAVAVALIILVFGLKLSHRIAGPLFNLTRFLKAIDPKAPKKMAVEFRDSDYFPELAEAVNESLGAQPAASSDLKKKAG